MSAPEPVRVSAAESSDDDPLLYLPCSTIVEHLKGAVIYGAEHPCAGIYAIIAGMVKVSRLAAEGQEVIVNIYRTDEVFGESALGTLPHRGEQAVALDKTMLMTWQGAKVEEIIEKRPKLGMALLRMLAQREVELAERLESFSMDGAAVRLGRSLMRLSKRLGTPAEGGTVRMRAFTQEFLAQYVGTARELVNTSMSQFRRQGVLKYSRQEIVIHHDALQEWLRQKASVQ